MSTVTVTTAQKRFPVAPDLYGAFFEDISRAGDGGLYPELLRNRSFEDSLLPEGCVTHDGGRTFVSPTGWTEEFNNGEGMDDWVRANRFPATPVPAWYTDGVEMTLDEACTLNRARRASLRVCFAPGGRLFNTGFAGVPQTAGRRYRLCFFVKAIRPVTLRAYVADGDRTVTDEAVFTADSAEWTRCDGILTARGTTASGAFTLRADNEGEIRFGFVSLMPEETFMGHGLRKDLAEKLKDMAPGFLRFPGGCIVEGFTPQTVMYFRNTVGPVWERPGHWLLWHYRTTNGLGFHEYLQLCEDLHAAPLYVCNCGMTCQGRGPYYFNEEETEDLIRDILAALEYALGGPDTEWGALRARMGHEAPFALKYLEIGNENSGDLYAERYGRIRRAVQEKYPQMIFIANDRAPSVGSDIADDHYYNMPEFYAENIGLYDSYDRGAPDVFVGEFSVNQTYEGQLRAAVAEAMFMTGFERNQDKVKLCSYAPLFEHMRFYSWYPNLIIYDNARSYAIPSYYVFRMFGRNRGEQVVALREETEKIFRDLHGLPVVTGDAGTRWRNARLNGAPVSVSRAVFGGTEKDGEAYVLTESADRPPFPVLNLAALGGDPDMKRYVFEAEMFTEPGRTAGIGALCAPKPLSFYDRMQPVPRDPWGLFNLEPIRMAVKDGAARVVRGGYRPAPMAPEVSVPVTENAYNLLRCEVDETCIRFSVNGFALAPVELPHYPAMSAAASDSAEEIVLKLVNFTEKTDPVRILTDCPVESDYRAERMSGAPDAENTPEDPEYVRDIAFALTGASQDFVYDMPPMSVNVLILKKRRDRA